MGKTLSEIEKWAEEREEGVLMMMGGDFNARTGTEGGEIGKMHNWRERERGGKKIKG